MTEGLLWVEVIFMKIIKDKEGAVEILLQQEVLDYLEDKSENGDKYGF